MKIAVTKCFSFEACHHLPQYEGACNRLHGHSYKLQVTVSDDVDEVTGMVLDFKIIKQVVQSLIINKYDHENLNNFFGNPTAEIMCRYIFNVLDVKFSSMGVILDSVKLWETEDSFVECSGGK